MVDQSGRPDYEPVDRAGTEEEGWGSPVPAEYGSLRSVRSPTGDRRGDPNSADRPNRPEPGRSSGRETGERRSGSSLIRRLQGDPGGGRSEAVPPAGPPPAGVAPSPSERLRARRPGPPGVPGGGAPGDGAPGSGAPGGGVLVPSERAPARPVADPPAGPGSTDGHARPPTRVPAVAAAAGGAAALADTAAIPVTRPRARPGPGEPAPTRAREMGATPPPEVGLAGRRARRRPGRVRSRATVRHLDLLTVIRVSLLFWLVMLVAVVVASVLLYEAADVFGSLPSIEKSVRTLFSLKSFQLHPGVIAEYTALGGAVVAVVGTLANIIFAIIYNLIAEVVGGVRVELETLASE